MGGEGRREAWVSRADRFTGREVSRLANDSLSGNSCDALVMTYTYPPVGKLIFEVLVN